MKGYGFLSFTKKMGKISLRIELENIVKKIFLIMQKKSARCAFKTASKGLIQKTTEVTTTMVIIF